METMIIDEMVQILFLFYPNEHVFFFGPYVLVDKYHSGYCF